MRERIREAAGPLVETVETVLRRSGWDWVDFVKMDVAGVTRALLERMGGWIDQAGSIGVEVHPPYSVEDCQRDPPQPGLSHLETHPPSRGCPGRALGAHA